MVYKSGQIFLPFCHNPRVLRTDRQTDRILIAIPRLHYMQRGKNEHLCILWLLSVTYFNQLVKSLRSSNNQLICIILNFKKI